MQSMKRIEYLNTAPEQLISDLTFSMIPIFYQPGEIVMAEGDKATRMLIVFEGIIEISSVMDNQSIFIIERLNRGAVINPTAFLVEDEVDTIFTAVGKVTVYSLSVTTFINETIKYSDFASRTALRINEQLGERDNAIALDYIIGKQVISYTSVNSKVVTMDLPTSERARRALLALKNAIFFFILKEREERKVPSLKSIL
jgi:CRP-like cAMP-binding protein